METVSFFKFILTQTFSVQEFLVVVLLERWSLFLGMLVYSSVFGDNDNIFGTLPSLSNVECTMSFQKIIGPLDALKK